MEEMIRSPPPPTTTTSFNNKRNQEMSIMSRVKKHCLSFAASLQESFRYIQAFFVGQVKKITARNEREATAADLQTAKMQVEATDEAENVKKEVDNKTM